MVESMLLVQASAKPSAAATTCGCSSGSSSAPTSAPGQLALEPLLRPRAHSGRLQRQTGPGKHTIFVALTPDSPKPGSRQPSASRSTARGAQGRTTRCGAAPRCRRVDARGRAVESDRSRLFPGARGFKDARTDHRNPLAKPRVAAAGLGSVGDGVARPPLQGFSVDAATADDGRR